MDIPAFVSRCCELANNDVAAAWTLVDLVLQQNMVVKWDSPSQMFHRPCGGHHACNIDHETMSELIFSRGIRRVHVCCNGIPDIDTIYRMLDTRMYNWVECSNNGRTLYFRRADNLDTCRRNTGTAHAWLAVQPVYTTVEYTGDAMIGRTMGG